MSDPLQRLDRYDRAVDESDTEVTVEVPSSSAAEEMFGRDGTAAADAMGRIFGYEGVEALRARVREVRRTSEGKLVVELDNNQVWVQTDTARLAVAAGDEVIIRRGRIGGYLLKKAEGNRSIRARRAN